MAREMSGSPSGRVEFSLEYVDEQGDRILAMMESATGDLASGAPIEELFDMTYTITNTRDSASMYYSATQTGFDPTAEIGPFVKE
jgi:hypothetical protein